jgi:hypothetical protein
VKLVVGCAIDAGVTANVHFVTATSSKVPMAKYGCNPPQLPSLPKAVVLLDGCLYSQVMPGLLKPCPALSSCIDSRAQVCYAASRIPKRSD